MAWMKVDHWLPNKPELVKIQRATGLTQPAVIGSLVLVWIWFSEHSVDGAIEADPGDLDVIAQREGFAAAMLKAGCLTSDGARLSMPGFEKWLGSALEARQRAQQRAGKGGVGNLSATVADIAPTVTAVSPTVGSQTQTQTQTQTSIPLKPPSGGRVLRRRRRRGNPEQVSRAVSTAFYTGPRCICGDPGPARSDGACRACKRIWRDCSPPPSGTTVIKA